MMGKVSPFSCKVKTPRHTVSKTYQLLLFSCTGT